MGCSPSSHSKPIQHKISPSATDSSGYTSDMYRKSRSPGIEPETRSDGRFDTDAMEKEVTSIASNISDTSGTSLSDVTEDLFTERTNLNSPPTDQKIEQAKERTLRNISTVLSNIKAEERWTDENGHYKSHILPSLRVIEESYEVLEDINASVEIVKGFRREIGSNLVTEGLIGEVCSTVNDVTKRKWGKDSNLRKLLVCCCVVIQNYSDGSEAVVEEVVKATGFLETLRHVLETSCRDYLEDKLKKHRIRMVEQALDIVHNCSQLEVSLSRLRSVGFIGVLEPYLQTKDDEYKLVSLAALASIIDENQSQIIANNERPVRVLVMVLTVAVGDQNRRCNGFSAQECALIVRQLARNDANKKLLVGVGILEPLVEMIKTGTDEEQLEAVRAIRVLAFDEDNQDRMVTDMDLDVVGVLTALKDKRPEDKPRRDRHQKISEECTKALWNMRKKLLESDKYNTVGEEICFQTPELPNGAAAGGSYGHVMISYQWSNQTVVKTVHKRLTENGLTVWIDIESMEGSTLQAMAEAVENADIVVVCASQKYKDSPNCRAEAEYAFEKRKKIIPCVMEPGYRPDGWLGLIIGSKLRFDFSGKYPFEQKIEGLLKEIHKHFKREEVPVHMQPKPINEPTIIPDVVDSRMTSSAPQRQDHYTPDARFRRIRDWKQSDVHNWIVKEGLPKERFGTLSGEDIALLARMQIQAPDSFYGCLQNVLQIKEMPLISRLAWALHDLCS